MVLIHNIFVYGGKLKHGLHKILLLVFETYLNSIMAVYVNTCIFRQPELDCLPRLKAKVAGGMRPPPSLSDAQAA